MPEQRKVPFAIPHPVPLPSGEGASEFVTPIPLPPGEGAKRG